MQLVYDPDKSGSKMTIVCFVSGSGTIVAGGGEAEGEKADRADEA